MGFYDKVALRGKSKVFYSPKKVVIFAVELNAEVAELVDALRSGRSGLLPVRVRISPSALIKTLSS